MENDNPSSSSSKSQFPTKEQAYEPEPAPKPEAVWIHDVFLSFRGEDTRASFTSHLYAALQNVGIKVFIDDNDLQRGDHISTSLSLAIEQSHISIIVFSINYADSRWCLDELKKIMVCRRTIGQVVVPVFYHLDPSDVRHLRGEFGIAFQRLFYKITNEVEINLARKLLVSGRDAIREAASIAGFVILNSKNESEDIKKIVDKVSHLLNKTDLFIARNPVGVETRVQDVVQLLPIKSNKVLLLGMWGMGGIGKTTIAKAIYNKIGRNFNDKSFIANIRENGEKIDGLMGLQEQLLFDICKELRMKIPNTQFGIERLQSKLSKKEVLIVLDDVNTLDQLNCLCGSREWFGPGSIIIITTRDMNLLRGRVDKIYEMTLMNGSESIELFSWNAFKQAIPTEDFVKLSENVVEYSGGLPLALEVLGSNLFNKKKSEWELVLEKLKKIPNSQVHKKLRISYDDLNDDDEKEIFLDIACFFIGMDQNDVILVLNECGLYAEIGISVLVERSLMTLDDKNIIGMHDLLRDMGREIIREQSPKVPEKCSRLWFQNDVIDILSRQIGKKSVMGLTLKLPSENSRCFSTKAFMKMKRLRLLQLAEVKLEGNFKYVSRDLRWLSWSGLSHIPRNFYRENLVSLELENSNVKLLRNTTMRMEKLKILNLSHSHRLIQSPDFSNMPNLEKIILKDCPFLIDLCPSIGGLKKILLIDLEDCIRLENLPRSIYKLKSLRTLILSGCLMIDNFEEDLEQMESSSRFPFSVIESQSIGYYWSYEEFSDDDFPFIFLSWMFPTLPSHIALEVPHSISQELSSISNYLPNLRSLWVEFTSENKLSSYAQMILYWILYSASSAAASQDSNSTTTLIQCCSQVLFPGSKQCLKSLLSQRGYCKATNFLKEKILQTIEVKGSRDYFLPCWDRYPIWLYFNSRGSSVTFLVPLVEGRNLNTMMCFVFTSIPNDMASDGCFKCLLVKNYTKTNIQFYKRETLASLKDEEGQRIVSSMEPGNKVEVVFVFENKVIVEKTSVYLIYDDEPVGGKVELYHVPNLRGIARRGDENKPTEEESVDDFNRNRKKKNRVQ